MRNQLHQTILILFLILVTASVVTAQTPRYEVTVLEPLEGPKDQDGETLFVPVWIASQINNAGQVAGTARRIGPTLYAAFRYTPGVGMENLDPFGNWSSFGRGINERGQVFGHTYKNLHSWKPTSQDSIFLYGDDEGFDFLEKGSSNHLVKNLLYFQDMNDAGDIIASVDFPGRHNSQSFLYTERDGWQDIAKGHPALRMRNRGHAGAFQINNAGDISIVYSMAGGFSDGYLLLGGEVLINIGNLGGDFFSYGSINEFGQMTGTARTTKRGDPAYFSSDHAYYFSVDEGLVDIQPRNFQESYPIGINSEGVVIGLLRKPGQVYDTLFTWAAQRRPRMKIVARRADFLALFKEGQELRNIVPYGMNENLEVIGVAQGRDEDDKAVRVFFYFSPETGVLDLSELFDPLESGATLNSLQDMNNRGDILAELEGRADGVFTHLHVVLNKVDE